MSKIFPILLIGCLSMLFAEVFSGSSQIWFISGWALLVTFPLYLGHVLFFLWIALKSKKMSLTQLYFLGVIFALYEAWITKVLWQGYGSQSGPMLGTFAGIGVSEFPMLVFFWHPIMAFILPILVFQILTGQAIDSHTRILAKTWKKTAVIILFLILTSTYIANGNGFNLISANLSLITTLLLILGLFYLSRKTDLMIFGFNRIVFVVLAIYLSLLYICGFFLLAPERIPASLTPYITIIAFYLLVILLFYKSEKTEIKLVPLDKKAYSLSDLIKFMIIIIFAVNIAVITSQISLYVLIYVITYCLYVATGTSIFMYLFYCRIKMIFAKKA